MEQKRAGTLKVSKRICAAVSRFDRGLRGGSVRRTGCYHDTDIALVFPSRLWFLHDSLGKRTSSLMVFSSS